MTVEKAPQLLSVNELAELLGIPVRTVYKLQYQGIGPKCVRIGRRVRFDPEDVAKWVEDRKQERSRREWW